jgi:predicted regulator of Ras-like GTPase activity (Roadblock/LC7/MglB family)
MSDIKTAIKRALAVDGCLGAALVDLESGLCLGVAGNPPFDLELAAAGKTEVVRATKAIRDKLGLKDEVDDILITMTGHHHMIRMVGTSMFLYMALDRSRGNLALARRELANIDRELGVDRL